MDRQTGRKGREGQKKKIGKANEKREREKVKRAKDEEVNGIGGKGGKDMPRHHMGHQLNHIQINCTLPIQTTTPALHQSISLSGRNALPDTQPTGSKH